MTSARFYKHYRIEARAKYTRGSKADLVVYDKVYNKYLRNEPNGRSYRHFSTSDEVFAYVKQRFIAIFSGNTHKWWAYDEFNDEYIDLPFDVIENLKWQYDNFDEQQVALENAMQEYPDWLDDKEHRYKDIEL